MKYNVYKIEDVLETIIDYRGKTPQKSDTGIPTLSAKSVKNNYIDYSNCYYISESEYKRFMVRGFPQIGDILLTTEAPMGMVARLNRDDVAVAQRLLTLRGKSEILDNDYLMYWLQSPNGQAALLARETGTTVTGIKQSEFRKVLIPLPDIYVQKKISSIFRCIDEKIQINKDINNNLLQQLHLLYVQLFSDLPMDTYLGDVVTTTSGGTPSRKHDEYYNNGSICWTKSKELLGGYLYDTEEHINELAVQKSSAKILPIHSVLIAMYGATVGAYGIISKSMTCNQAICALLSNENYPYTYLFQIAHESQQKLINLAVGSAQQNISQVLIKQLPVHSKVDTICKFHQIAQPIHEQIEILQAENNQLSKLRDTLLPKLMSGEIDVSNIQL